MLKKKTKNKKVEKNKKKEGYRGITLRRRQDSCIQHFFFEN
jgi:hypothetical protein